MYQNNDGHLFEDLKDLGFDTTDALSIYKKETSNHPSKKISSNHNSGNTLFDRKIQCPVCHNHIAIRSVKSSSIRVISRDTDFMVHYGLPNPLLYNAWVCIQCGYAALSTDFQTLTDKQIIVIREKICSKWKQKDYPSEFDVSTAIERYKLALLNSIVKNSKASEKALTCLKIAWLYRLAKDEINEIEFLKRTIHGLQSAYQNERFPISKMDESSVCYLIGELYRRVGENQAALQWFSKVFSFHTAKNHIKDMARDQKYMIMNENNNAPPPNTCDVGQGIQNDTLVKEIENIKSPKIKFLKKLFK